MVERIFVVACSLLVLIAGCGSSGRTQSLASPEAVGVGGSSSGSSSGRAEEARHPALAPLRPAGADEVNAALTRAPSDVAANARAAVFYSGTDVAGMALLYGMTHVALSGDGGLVAEPMVRVLRERIVVRVDGTTRHIATRLAPGSMPAIASGDGSLRAPVAHVFELQIGPALATFEGGWTLAKVVAMLQSLVAGLRDGSPLDSRVELNRWLVRLADAGHLAGFAAVAFGPGLGETSAEVGAARAWIAAHPFRPSHAVLPDDLVRIR